MPAVGEVWQHLHFYIHADTGKPLTKHLFILAFAPNKDVIYRLLTSREAYRSRTIMCAQSGFRPGYYLGTPQAAGILKRPTWLDLRESENYDAHAFKALTQHGQLSCIHAFPIEITCPALECAADAPTTNEFQKQQMKLSRAMLNCP